MNTPRKNKRRLFFALWPNAAERTALAAWQLPLRELCGGRTMRPDTLHATLVFMGDVFEHRLVELVSIAQEINFQCFALDWSEVCYWQHNHIVYAAPETTPPQLAHLVSELATLLREHGFHFERRDYQVHVTLLRNAKWNDMALPRQSNVCWLVRDFALVQSLGDEQGARYEVLARFPLSD